MNRRRFLCASALLIGRSRAQNIVEGRSFGPTAPPLKISPDQVSNLLAFSWKPRSSIAGDPPELAGRLDECMVEKPWRPFHCVLGISGFETLFSHPDEWFLVASLHGDASNAALAKRLSDELARRPPYAAEGYAFHEGEPRERHDVPPHLIPDKRGAAEDLFGIYSLWIYSERFGHKLSDAEQAALLARIQQVLSREQPLDFEKPLQNGDVVERLNGNIAGVIGFLRMFPNHPDAGALQEKLRALVELRINLERRNAWPLAATSAASKGLHNQKLARYLRLTPELAFALREWTDGCAAARLAALRAAFPTWWLAFGERLIGGENYISPPHFSRALFAGAALIEHRPASELHPWLDVPWCRADWNWLEKAAWLGLALAEKSQ